MDLHGGEWRDVTHVLWSCGFTRFISIAFAGQYLYSAHAAYS